jgi:hypothetical protein
MECCVLGSSFPDTRILSSTIKAYSVYVALILAAGKKREGKKKKNVFNNQRSAK